MINITKIILISVIFFHAGFVSMFTLCALSMSRLGTFVHFGRMKGQISSFYSATKIICIIWLYSSALSLPPLLGWGRYVPELSGLG